MWHFYLLFRVQSNLYTNRLTTGNGGNVQKRGDVKNDKKLLFYAIIDHLIDKDSLKNTTDIDFGRDGLNSLQILLLILFEWFRFK